MVRLSCPKCGASFLWEEYEAPHIVRRCICGYRRYLVFVSSDGVFSEVPEHDADTEIVLAAKGTKTRACLTALMEASPVTITTVDIAGRTHLQVKETSAILSYLMERGLVERVSIRKGGPNGASWRLVPAVLDIMHREEGIYGSRDYSS